LRYAAFALPSALAPERKASLAPEFRLSAALVPTIAPVRSMALAILVPACGQHRAGSRALMAKLRAGTKNGALPPRSEN